MQLHWLLLARGSSRGRSEAGACRPGEPHGRHQEQALLAARQDERLHARGHYSARAESWSLTRSHSGTFSIDALELFSRHSPSSVLYSSLSLYSIHVFEVCSLSGLLGFAVSDLQHTSQLIIFGLALWLLFPLCALLYCFYICKEQHGGV